MKYSFKITDIEAFVWFGDIRQDEDPEWASDAVADGRITFEYLDDSSVIALIKTLHGISTAHQGDYIIKHIDGQLYPCAPETFHKLYKLA